MQVYYVVALKHIKQSVQTSAKSFKGLILTHITIY